MIEHVNNCPSRPIKCQHIARILIYGEMTLGFIARENPVKAIDFYPEGKVVYGRGLHNLHVFCPVILGGRVRRRKSNDCDRS